MDTSVPSALSASTFLRRFRTVWVFQYLIGCQYTNSLSFRSSGPQPSPSIFLRGGGGIFQKAYSAGHKDRKILLDRGGYHLDFVARCELIRHFRSSEHAVAACASIVLVHTCLR